MGVIRNTLSISCVALCLLSFLSCKKEQIAYENLDELKFNDDLSLKRKQNEDFLYSHKGVGFYLPKNWHVMKEEVIINNTCMLYCENNNINNGGIITVRWSEGKLDLDTLLNLNIRLMRNNSIYKQSNLLFSKEKSLEHNKLMFKTVKYSSNMLGLDHFGEILCFELCNRTFTIQIQSTREDLEEANKNLQKILNTLFCVEGLAAEI